MLRRSFLILIVGLSTLVASAASADTLRVDMVKASNSGEPGVDAKLKSFEKLLKSLPFKRFELVESKSGKLPGTNLFALKAYSMTCSGKASDLAVTVAHKQKELVNTKVSVAGTPFIQGSFPDAADKDASIWFIISIVK